MIGMLDIANRTIRVIPTQTCVKEQSWGVKLWGQTPESRAHTADRWLGRFVMVNASEPLNKDSSTLAGEKCDDTPGENARGWVEVPPATPTEWSLTPSGSKTAPKTNVKSNHLNLVNPMGSGLREAGKQTVRDANAQRAEELAKSERLPAMGRIGTMYRSERRLTCQRSNYAGKARRQST